MDIENLHKHIGLTDGENNSVKVHVAGHHVATVWPALGGGYTWGPIQSFYTNAGIQNLPFSQGNHPDMQTAIADALSAAYDNNIFDTAVEIPDDSNAMSEGHGEKPMEMPLVKFKNKKPVNGDPSGLHGLEDYMKLKDKKMTNEEMTAAQMDKRERIVKALKKSKAEFVKKYGEKATSVMYATATKQAMKEEVELDEAMKPYVSGDHAEGWSILDSKGKEVKKFHHKDYADHPIADKKVAAKNDAMAYLKKHFSKLSEETLDEGNFAHYVQKADSAKSKGDAQEAKHHLQYASKLYNAMNDDEKSKHTKHVDLYKKMTEETLSEASVNYDKHSFIGKIKRGIEADAKGWGQLGKEFAAKSKEEKEKAIARGNRYFKITREETVEEKKDPCWKGYKQLGMKNKGGKQVPNCIPEQEEIKEEGEVLGGTTVTDPISKTDAIARADFKLSAAGRKIRRRIILKK